MAEIDRLNRETRAAWESNAEFWDERADQGLPTQDLLVGPTTERLLELTPGQRILDIACGNGSFARQLAKLGAQVVAFDFSPKMVELARRRSTEYQDRIEYHILDATKEEELLKLGRQEFDGAVANMSLMDISDLRPLAVGLTQILKPRAAFVFSVTHPCFNNTSCVHVAEQEDREGEIIETYSIKVSGYRDLKPAKGVAIIGQPAAQYYFDRPINQLLAPFFSAGFAVDGLEEPCFEERLQGKAWFSWGNYQEIPPVLIVRVRLLG